MIKFNEPIDDEFEKAYLFFKQGKFILDESFKKAFFDFLDKYNSLNYWKIHDSLFQNFGFFWYYTQNGILFLRPFQTIDSVFTKVLSLVHEWEDRNGGDKIHKGAPYYFYGAVSILKGDIDKGLLLMHQAYNDDRKLISAGLRSNDLPTPALCFISLDSETQEQFFRDKVRETVNFVDQFLTKYRKSNNTSLKINPLRDKFLENNSYEEESFFFVYCVFKLEKIITKINQNIRKNVLASYLETTIIFELCKLAEVLLKKIYPEPEIKRNYSNKSDYIHYIDYFCRDQSVNLNLRQNNIGFLNRELNNNFQNTIQGLMGHSFTHNDFISNPDPIEYDISLTYCLRNFGGHKIEDQQTICDEFKKIVSSILNFIFFIIEKKY